MESQFLFRNALLEADPAEIATGKIRLSFASEVRVLRHDKKRGQYYEVLSHAPGDANLGLINSQGVVFEDHDETRQIGDVEKKSARVEADKKTRANILLTDEAWKKRIAGGERPGVSVGYVALEPELKREESGVDNIPVIYFAWRAFEISLLNSAPADSTVGLFRSKKRQCPDCDGSGECPECEDGKRSGAACEHCGGNQRCAGCRGNGYITTARAASVDFWKGIDVEQITKSLTADQKKRMKILFDKDGGDGNGGAAAALDAVKVRGEGQAAERARVTEIRKASEKLVKDFGMRNKGELAKSIRDMADEAIEKDEAPQSFSNRALQSCASASQEPV